jgi:urease accessory protein
LPLAPPPVRPPASTPAFDERQLHARAHLAVDRFEGATRVIECWGEPPLLPRQTPGGITMVGSAAGPMGGDRLSTVVEVGAGANLAVDSVAATYARPGPADEESSAVVRARVGPQGSLAWGPEPLVGVGGCRHRAESVVDLGAGAELFWVDVMVLGRHGEEGGQIWSKRSVHIDGRPLNRQALHLGPGTSGPDPAVLGGARVVASCLMVNPEWAVDREGLPAVGRLQIHSGPNRAGVLKLAGPAIEVVGLGPSVKSVLDAWSALAERLGDCAPVSAGALADYVTKQR